MKSYEINARLKRSYADEGAEVMSMLKRVTPVGVAEIVYEYGANYDILSLHSLRAFWDAEEKRWRMAYMLPVAATHEGFARSSARWVFRQDYPWADIVISRTHWYWFNAGAPVSIDLKYPSSTSLTAPICLSIHKSFRSARIAKEAIWRAIKDLVRC